VSESEGVKNILLPISTTMIKFLAWATICYLQSGVIEGKIRMVSHLAKSGSPVLYIIFIYNLYTSLYKVCARACPSSLWGFFRRYSGQVGRGSGLTGQGIALGHKDERYSVSRGNGHSREERRTARNIHTRAHMIYI